jgi:hypothetical protein
VLLQVVDQLVGFARLVSAARNVLPKEVALIVASKPRMVIAQQAIDPRQQRHDT